MSRLAAYRLTHAALRDIEDILATSEERWGVDGRDRYRELVISAIAAVAAMPRSALTRVHPFLRPGIRSFHIRHARRGRGVAAGRHLAAVTRRG